MPVRDHLLSLQWGQLKHDELYHKEIVLLPVAERMKHMALHMAKYAGNIAAGIDDGDTGLLERAIVDSFIIALASANTVTLDIGKELDPDRQADSLKSIGADIAGTFKRRQYDDGWFLRRFVREVSRLAKACESLDHMEAFPFRETIRDSIFNIFKLLLVEASDRQVDIVELAKARLAGVEAKHMFHSHYEAMQVAS